MKHGLSWFVGLLGGALIALPGCLLPKPDFAFDEDLVHFGTVATNIEYPDVLAPTDEEIVNARPPRTIQDSEVEYWGLTLQEVVHLALTHSKVMRDLGATVLRSPDSLRTSYGPAIQDSDPQFGVEAALSAFDTEFSTSFFFDKNDRRLNNQFLGNLGFFQQDYDVFQAELTKRAATGGQFTLRKNIDFDNNNSLANQFPNGAWNVNLEGEVRQPLCQGGGLLFNRIAGPGGTPGVFNGVLIARVKTDISLAEFELAVRDFISNVENAYWDLYFAYRDLDVKIRARDKSLEIWRRIHALYAAGRRGGEAENEAQARAQYLRFEEDVQNALTGRLLEGTRTNNGSSSGTFRGSPGVHVNERRLRLLMGLPPNGDRLIRPADEPPISPVAFDWGQITTESLARRAELRRQRWQVKNREMELTASKNFLLPDLDIVGRYRWRGFGEKLLDAHRPGNARFDNAFMDLTSGDFQEWQLGVEFSVPIGFRQAHASVRNAELRLSQAKTVLSEQQRQVIHDLSNAVAEKDRAYAVLQTNYNRCQAAKQLLDALETVQENQPVTTPELFVVLDAQRRYADAESSYYQTQIEYALALKNVHFEKGSFLDYCGVVLSEGLWPGKAYVDAAKRDCLRGRERPINYTLNNPPIVSQGTYPQQILPDPQIEGEVRPDPFIEEPPESPQPLLPPSVPPGQPTPSQSQQSLGPLRIPAT